MEKVVEKPRIPRKNPVRHPVHPLNQKILFEKDNVLVDLGGEGKGGYRSWKFKKLKYNRWNMNFEGLQFLFFNFNLWNPKRTSERGQEYIRLKIWEFPTWISKCSILKMLNVVNNRNQLLEGRRYKITSFCSRRSSLKNFWFRKMSPPKSHLPM